MKFDKIDWSKAFFKTYLEKRSFLHLLVNFNRIWVMHISVFWIYTAWNSPSIYAQKNTTTATRPMIFSMSALGGAVACLIMIVATCAEFSYIPTTWNNTSHLARRLAFLAVILAITGGPSIYIAFFNQESNVSLIISIVQFAVAICAVIMFSIVPSGRMFGDRVAGKNRKYLANQTFTASYPSLTRSSRIASISLWVLVFGLKYVESYFFLTLSFRDPIKVMTGMKVQNCNDKVFGNALCRNQAAFALALMFVMDLCLFFLDTFLWYVIWNTVFSIGRSFALGMSVWTPWKDIFMRLPKRIYAKLLATADMEVKYKPKVSRPAGLTWRDSDRICPLGSRLASLECHHHLHVPRASLVYRPRPEATLPPSAFRQRWKEDLACSGLLHRSGCQGKDARVLPEG
jgi:1,3-beta-glucan synthase